MMPSAQEPTSSSSDDVATPSDEELVEHFQAGDTRAFDALFQRHNQALCAFVIHQTDDARGRELVMEAFYRAYINLLSLKKNASFKAWLYRIAINLIKDEWKRTRRIRWFSLDTEEKSFAEEIFIDGFERQIEQSDFIQQVMRYAPQKYRICTYLDVFQDLSQREIADLLDMRERTVRRYIARGKEALRAVYDRLEDNLGALKRKENR